MKRTPVLLFLFFLTACEVEDPFKPTPLVPRYGSIEGVIKLSDGGFASGISVELIHRGGCFLCGWPGGGRSRVATVTTDEAGRFEFEEISIGRYMIDLGSFPGYTRGILFDPPSFNVQEGKTTPVSYTLYFVPQTFALTIDSTDASGEDRIRLRATFVNAGENPVSFSPCGGSPRFSARDSAGKVILLRNPRVLRPCGGQVPDLAPGSTIEGVLDFGYAWTRDGGQYRLPAGEYLVRATMGYDGGIGLRFHGLNSSLIIDWE